MNTELRKVCDTLNAVFALDNPRYWTAEVAGGKITVKSNDPAEPSFTVIYKDAVKVYSIKQAGAKEAIEVDSVAEVAHMVRDWIY